MAKASGPRVLMIDDDPSVLGAISSVLGALGYQCETATDGQIGLRRFDEGGWDLVLTDLAMPEVSGWDVIAAIRHNAPTTPVLVMTGLHDPDLIQRARESRVPVILKPFRLEALKTALVEALSAKPT